MKEMIANIHGKKYECRAIVVDADKTTIFYGTYADDGLENKTDIIGTPSIEIDNGEICYTIDWYKKRLAETDYVVIKIAEGSATYDEYADIIVQRRTWREAINRIESGLN